MIAFVRSHRTFAAFLTAIFLSACGGGGGGSSSNSGGNASTAMAPASNVFSGTVTFNGTPMQGVTIIAFHTNTNSPYATTTTDANGRYSFTGFYTSCATGCKMNYQFWPVKSGYAFYPVMASNPSGDRASYLWDSSPSNWYVNSGAAVSRSDYTGQFLNSVGGSGIIFTVLNFNSSPNNSVTDGDFVAYDGSAPLVHLAKTGQVVSYVAGDDASRQAGVAWPITRFVDNHDGTVTDALTGLIWLRDAGCLQPNNWGNALAEANQLSNGACGLSDGSTAGQWRMPNMWELESLIDESASSPALSAGNPFVNVSNGNYWTSTSYYGGIGGSPVAWAIRMSDGRYINDGISNLKTTGVFGAWAVKGKSNGAVKLQATGMYVPYVAGDDGNVEAGVPFTFPRMRDNGDGTVTDTVTGLVWLKLANCIHKDWGGAIAAVNSLASGQCGLTDGSTAGQWRMPNRKELESLADRSQNNQADLFDSSWTSRHQAIGPVNAVFSNFIQLEYYWTSTTSASNTTEAWTVFSCDYGIYNISKSNAGYTLAVR